MIRVLVVDDHPVLRSGLAALLERADGITLVGLAADGEEGVRLAQQQRPAVELTPREREVLLMVAEGLSNKVIARRLEIREGTVKAHLTRIFERIGVSDRTQAALWAERQRLAGR